VPHLTGIGFKILLDIALTAPRTFRVLEIQADFQPRESGQSKFDSRAMFDFFMLIMEKTVGRWAPAWFVVFAAIGSFGVVVYLATVWILFKVLPLSFMAAQACATLVAMTFNFLLNNELTYRDRRLRGPRMLRGWLTFALSCSVGLVANVGVAAELFSRDQAWWLAALGGIAIGAVWNYAVTSFYTWGKS
jgi:dolichol-phosphate mannosyltransferase